MKRFTILSFCLALSPVLIAGKPQQITSPNQVPEGVAKSDWASIRAAYEAGRHQFFKQDDGSHVARNPGLGWKMKFDEHGFTATPDGGGWTWGLQLETNDGALGKAGHRVPTASSVQGDGLRSSPVSIKDISAHSGGLGTTCATLAFPRTPAITEWFINDQRGLEHGWTLAAPAEIRLRVRGSLKPAVSAQSITFGGQITYSGLKAWDAKGKTIPTHFEATAEGFAVRYDDSNAQYPLTIDPVAQEAYVKASNTGAYDNFGWSVALSGDTAVIGAPLEDSSATGVNGNQADNIAGQQSGAAYIFVRSGSTWTQQAYLKASNAEEQDRFGWSVAVSGDTVVIGALYEDSSATGVGGNQADNGSFASGAAYVFVRSGTTWTQEAYLKASNTRVAYGFGSAVALSGDTAIVGSYEEDSSATGVGGNQADVGAQSSGAAYVFVRSGSTWTQQAYLKASNTDAFDKFGSSVALSGDTAVVGAPYESSSAAGVGGNQADNGTAWSGAAYVFVRSGSNWSQQAYLKASNPGQSDNFGNSVTVSGDTVVIGAPTEDSNATGVNGNQANDNASNSGAAYVFVRSGGEWAQQAYLKASNTIANSQFGWAVALTGDTALIGAPWATISFAPGAAYAFTRSGTTWTQQSYLKLDDTFGYSVALSGDTAIIGAPLEASNATGVGGNQADNNASDSGASYIFTGLGPPPAPTVTGITPSTGATTGGTSVTITGTNFTGATGVSIGGSAATGAVVVNATTITCSTPAHAVGAASVVVTTLGGSNAANALFTYFTPAPEIAVEQPLSNDLTSGSSSIDFGSAIVASSNTLTFTLKNTGTATLTSLALSKSGDHAADFILGGLGSPAIAARTSGTFTVTFTPTASGARTATLAIASNDSDENPFFITLTGTGTPQAPTATTGGASTITQTTSTVAGTVDAKGSETTVTFEYGLTTAYGSTATALASPLSGSGAQVVTANLTGLLGHKLYHYRVKAANGGGTVNGADKTFTTLNTVPVTNADSTTALPGGVVTINAGSNDSDSDGDTLTLSTIKTAPPASAGTAKIVAGNVVFIAAATFAGTSFTYTVSDGFGGTAIGTVNVALGSCSLSPASVSVPAAATSYPVAVTTSEAWSATETLAWATLSPTSGAGNGSVTVTLLANATKIARTGVITIGGKAHTIVQAGTLGFTIDPPPSVPTGAVSADYSLTIPALTPLVKFTMTGHPSGLAIHPTTGVISGKPKVAGTFKVSVTGSTTAGASTTLSFMLTVNPLPVGAVGTYHGPIAREDTLNGGLGGRFEMTTTATGSFTGKVILGAVSYSFPPSLLLTTSVGNASPTASFNILRKAPLPALTVSFTLDSATHLLTGGDITDGTHHASFTAWRKKWGTVMTQPEKDDLNRYVGLHTFALQVPVGQPALPQGSGYGAFTVAANTGALTAAGKLADNTVFTCATFAGPNGEVLIYQALYTSKGSIVGALDIAPGTIGFVPPFGDNTITGTVSWLRPAITGRVYATGFGPYDLTAVGGRYVPPVAPKLALGITDDLVNNNATLAFSGVTIINTSPNIAFRLKTGSVFVPPPVANNSRKTTLKVTQSTGYFTGGFSLSDPNAIVTTAVRPATYYGQIVRDTGGVLRGYGYYLLADSPAIAGETVNNTKQKCGLVLLEKNP